MKKRMTILIIGLAVVFGGIIAFHLVKGFLIKQFFSHFEAPPVSVSSVTARLKTWKPHISAIGNFVAINGVEVNTQAAGNVVTIHFDSGQYVENKAPLIDIDDSIEQANLKFSQADRELKEINYKRQLDLFKRGSTSSSSVDEAKANLQQAQANVEKIQAQISQKHISAPFAGQLGIRQVNLGQYISPGQTAIVTLQSLDPLFLEFNLPEQLFKLLHVNQGIKFRVEAFPNAVFTGKISAINSKVDPKTHNILVQATLPNCSAKILKQLAPKLSLKKDSSLKTISCNSDTNSKNKEHQFLFLPGMFASIDVELVPIPNLVVLPSTAISYSLYGDTVFVIERAKEGKKDAQGQLPLQVRRVFILKGEQAGNDTVILKGIKAGDMVVSSGEVKLQNGTHVVINNSIMLNEINDPDSLSE